MGANSSYKAMLFRVGRARDRTTCRATSTGGNLEKFIGCCKLNNVDPYQYLADVLGRINGHCHKDLQQLLPHNWKPLQK